jgi:hypothetical protein
MYDVRPCTDEDIEYLKDNLRDADVREIAANSGEEPEDALHMGRQVSQECWVGLANGTPFVIFGVTAQGGVWLLATKDIEKHKRHFLRQCRAWLNKLHAHHACLWNYVDERNTLHLAWLQWMGFVFVERLSTFGHEGRPFWKIEHHV